MASRPWNDVKGQIYLGSEAFIEKHASGTFELTSRFDCSSKEPGKLPDSAVIREVFVALSN
jgi:hypothetical protein